MTKSNEEVERFADAGAVPIACAGGSVEETPKGAILRQQRVPAGIHRAPITDEKSMIAESAG